MEGWILDTRYWILETGCSITDIFWNLEFEPRAWDLEFVICTRSIPMGEFRKCMVVLINRDFV